MRTIDCGHRSALEVSGDTLGTDSGGGLVECVPPKGGGDWDTHISAGPGNLFVPALGQTGDKQDWGFLGCLCQVIFGLSVGGDGVVEFGVFGALEAGDEAVGDEAGEGVSDPFVFASDGFFDLGEVGLVVGFDEGADSFHEVGGAEGSVGVGGGVLEGDGPGGGVFVGGVEGEGAGVAAA